ncbi:PTS IIA-like nitrogen regulatory protein PtsN [Oceanimonas baumannii]|uniref:PTS IIA-like nitrogen-regulatory protein PtsN n=1 Tax=Oceanimonas baumannii TaxID=129578 RepID=A0A235CIY6_9GAMM|nr:PTS IIA-like nitrogen regulatory protein PtsN [Oceanimonas baumannii]MCC4264910.1 PTS IIA-like nitrogen regulatory protein PtsN [Oceanimonas baumannii]OYD24571.1 PTS IIA-like nitrogen-regulatory protein PtsN [Oceanimonas baumannii]TDW59307.1 phosphotransferase IIA-like nitrogen-regulatory protein PtsN [Oceanimonas baumannii]
MEVADILSRDCTRSAVPCTSKKRALEIISELAAGHLNIGSQPLFDCLLAREKMGTTGIGNGIAIPHGRIGNDNKATAVLLTFAEPVEFDAIDNQPVGLVFALLVPEQECKQHLKTLSLIAEKLSNKQVCRQLRQAGSDEELYQIMISA